MPRKLKVYRTPVGFRDAYVAAPSQAAALRAWGTRKNLFARGAAEQVTDTELAREALSKPGEVVYRTRGSLEEQVAALGPTPKAKPPAKPEPGSDPKAGTDKKPEAPPAKRRPRAKPKPRPSRAKLEAAEEALALLAEEHETAEREMRAREEALKRERAAMEKAHAAQLDRLERERDRARTAYEKALQQWKP